MLFGGIKNTVSQTNIRKIKNGTGRFQSKATTLKFGGCNPLSSILTLAIHRCLELDLKNRYQTCLIVPIKPKKQGRIGFAFFATSATLNSNGDQKQALKAKR